MSIINFFCSCLSITDDQPNISLTETNTDDSTATEENTTKCTSTTYSETTDSTATIKNELTEILLSRPTLNNTLSTNVNSIILQTTTETDDYTPNMSTPDIATTIDRDDITLGDIESRTDDEGTDVSTRINESDASINVQPESIASKPTTKETTQSENTLFTTTSKTIQIFSFETDATIATTYASSDSDRLIETTESFESFFSGKDESTTQTVNEITTTLKSAPENQRKLNNGQTESSIIHYMTYETTTPKFVEDQATKSIESDSRNGDINWATDIITSETTISNLETTDDGLKTTEANVATTFVTEEYLNKINPNDTTAKGIEIRSTTQPNTNYNVSETFESTTNNNDVTSTHTSNYDDDFVTSTIRDGNVTDINSASITTQMFTESFMDTELVDRDFITTKSGSEASSTISTIPENEVLLSSSDSIDRKSTVSETTKKTQINKILTATDNLVTTESVAIDTDFPYTEGKPKISYSDIDSSDEDSTKTQYETTSKPQIISTTSDFTDSELISTTLIREHNDFISGAKTTVSETTETVEKITDGIDFTTITMSPNTATEPISLKNTYKSVDTTEITDNNLSTDRTTDFSDSTFNYLDFNYVDSKTTIIISNDMKTTNRIELSTLEVTADTVQTTENSGSIKDNINKINTSERPNTEVLITESHRMTTSSDKLFETSAYNNSAQPTTEAENTISDKSDFTSSEITYNTSNIERTTAIISKITSSDDYEYVTSTNRIDNKAAIEENESSTLDSSRFDITAIDNTVSGRNQFTTDKNNNVWMTENTAMLSDSTTTEINEQYKSTTSAYDITTEIKENTPSTLDLASSIVIETVATVSESGQLVTEKTINDNVATNNISTMATLNVAMNENNVTTDYIATTIGMTISSVTETNLAEITMNDTTESLLEIDTQSNDTESTSDSVQTDSYFSIPETTSSGSRQKMFITERTTDLTNIHEENTVEIETNVPFQENTSDYTEGTIDKDGLQTTSPVKFKNTISYTDGTTSATLAEETESILPVTDTSFTNVYLKNHTFIPEKNEGEEFTSVTSDAKLSENEITVPYRENTTYSTELFETLNTEFDSVSTTEKYTISYSSDSITDDGSENIHATLVTTDGNADSDYAITTTDTTKIESIANEKLSTIVPIEKYTTTKETSNDLMTSGIEFERNFTETSTTPSFTNFDTTESLWIANNYNTSDLTTSTANLSPRKPTVDIMAWTDTTDLASTELYSTTDITINNSCKEHSHCPMDKACLNGACKNPCVVIPRPCTEHTACKVDNHEAVCECGEASGVTCIRGMLSSTFFCIDRQFT